jgi:Flp pilus assembly protein TadG
MLTSKVNIVMKRLTSGESGLALVLVSLAMVVLLSMTALVVDVGAVTLHKNRLANACDAAALAGARELPNTGAATQVANNYINLNGVSPDDTRIEILEGGKKIKVASAREVEFTFARVLGFTSTTVNADATAIFGAISSATGIIPLSVPEQELNFGHEYKLKVGAPGLVSGNFGALALEGSGADKYRTLIKEGYNGLISVGDWVTTEPGNMSGPTRDGINHRTSQCTHNCTVDNYDPSCKRVVIVPVYDPETMGGGRNEVMVVGFAAFLLSKDAVKQGKECTVYGYFLQTTPPPSSSFSVDPDQNDFGLRSVRLTS